MLRFCLPLAAAASAACAVTVSAGTIDVTVTIENLAPQMGTYQTPFWVGFHDGGFDLFDVGAPASASLERLVEDGTTMFVSNDFTSSGFGSQDGVIAPGGPFAPGSIASGTFTLDSSDPTSRYFSYASMVIPSNDAFIGNDDPTAISVFNAAGNFVGGEFVILGSAVLDGGTEVNDELPMNTAFFGQSMPNTGTPENGVVAPHPGYLGSLGNPGTPSILADPMFANADFTVPGYQVARITIVPGPAGAGLLAVAGLFARRRRRSQG